MKKVINVILDKLKDYVEKCTLHFQNDQSKNFTIAYVYFMKNYYELKYADGANRQPAELENYADSDPKRAELYAEINKCIEALNSAVPQFNFAPIQIPKKGGSRKIFEKMLGWTTKTPKSTILKHLEEWTGERGEAAVMKTMRALRNNSNLLFDKIMQTNGVNEISNRMISASAVRVIEKLFHYYLRHREKYADPSSTRLKDTRVDPLSGPERKNTNHQDTRTLEIGEKIRIVLRDKYISLDTKFGVCDFKSFAKTVEDLVSGINAVDKEVLMNYTGEGRDSDAPEIRRGLKKKISELARTVGKKLSCTVLKNSIKFEAAELIPLIRSLHQAEKLISQNAEAIRENLHEQAENIQKLMRVVDELVGPDTRPCILRVAAALVARSEK